MNTCTDGTVSLYVRRMGTLNLATHLMHFHKSMLKSVYNFMMKGFFSLENINGGGLFFNSYRRSGGNPS